MNSESSDQRLDYWRRVARAAEQDLQRLRDGIRVAIAQTENDAAAAERDEGFDILDALLGTLRRLASQPVTPHQRAQDAYTAVNDPSAGDAS